MFSLIHHQNGPRLYLLGKRIHHGSFGLVLILLGAKVKKLRVLSAIGSALVLHDIEDFPWTDKNNH